MEADSPQPSGASKVDLPNDPGKMFIGGLSWETTEEGLSAFFSEYGDLKECVVMRDPNTKQSRGFGFVTFKDPTAVDKVLASCPHELDHKKIDPKVAVPKRPQPKMITRTKKIFVGGVSASSSEEDLTNYFKQFGEVVETKLMQDKVTNRHRGFGFVTFETEDAAERACEEQYHVINDKKTEVKKAQPREVMYSLQGGRGRAGRTLGGRGFLYNYPFAQGFPRGFPPSGFGPGFGNYPFPGGYSPAAAAAAAAFAAQSRQIRGKGRGYLGNYPGMLGFTGYPHGYMSPPDQRGRTQGGQYYADYAAISSQGGRPGHNRPPDIPQVNPAMHDYTDYQGMNYPTPAFGPPPPSPVSRAFATAATSPGPVQDLNSYINSATNTSADALGYTATSPQPTGFGHAITF